MSDEAGKRTLDDLAVGMLITWCGDEYRLTEREYDADSPGWVGVTTGRGESKPGIVGLFRPWLINDKEFVIVKPSEFDRVTAERDALRAQLDALGPARGGTAGRLEPDPKYCVCPFPRTLCPNCIHPCRECGYAATRPPGASGTPR